MKSKNVKKIFVVLITTLIMSGAIIAQSKERPPRIPDSAEIENIVNKLADDISLSTDQKNEILNLYNNHFEEIKEKMENNRERNKNNREERKEHREEFQKQVKSLLSDEQKEKYDEFNKNTRPDRKHDRKKGDRR